MSGNKSGPVLSLLCLHVNSRRSWESVWRLFECSTQNSFNENLHHWFQNRVGFHVNPPAHSYMRAEPRACCQWLNAVNWSNLSDSKHLHFWLNELSLLCVFAAWGLWFPEAGSLLQSEPVNLHHFWPAGPVNSEVQFLVFVFMLFSVFHCDSFLVWWFCC